MPVTAGDFSPSQLASAIRTADQMWSDDMMKPDFLANVDIVKALKAEQNARVDILQDPEKDREVKVHWINMCGESVSDCSTDDCDIAGNELGTDSKTYALGECKSWSFTVDEMKFRTNDYSMEQVVAKGILKADKILSEAIAANLAAKIESFKGTNVVTDGIGTVNGATTETDISAADWNERAFAYFYRVAIQNQLSNPFLLSGTNMFEDYFVANANKGNGEGKGAAALYSSMRKYFDLFNIDTANSPDLKSYMINRGSIAFASKSYYGAVPTKYKEQDRYSLASRNIDGMRMDVYYTNRCSSNTILHDFKFKIKFDWFLNPLGCDATRTGVLAFNKV